MNKRRSSSAVITRAVKIDIALSSAVTLPTDWPRRLRAAARMAWNHLPKKQRLPVVVNLLITNNPAIRQLNRDFRGMDKPTNVLSFPQFTPRQLVKLKAEKGLIPLGDIALSYPYIVTESKRDHKILINHAQHLMIHGLLHLFGYDHISLKDAVRMERLEKKIMAALGLPDPYRVETPDKPNKKHRK